MNITVYGEVDESILVDTGLKIVHRGEKYQARTLLDDLPDASYVENTVNPLKSKKLKEGEKYFDLQEYIDKINASNNEIADEYEY